MMLRFRRAAAVLGVTAALLGAALFVHVPAADASPGQVTRSARVQGGETADSPKLVYSSTNLEIWYSPDSYPSDWCRDFEVCIWTQDHYSGYGAFFSGNYAPCEGWRFEGTLLQDRTNSIMNKASGPISIWNRFSDGSYRYNKYGWLPSGYVHDTEFSRIMDAWVYDPGNNCGNLNLHLVPRFA